MTEKWIIDDAGTLINIETRENYDYVSDVCNLLNEKDKQIKKLEKELKKFQPVIFKTEDGDKTFYEKEE